MLLNHNLLLSELSLYILLRKDFLLAPHELPVTLHRLRIRFKRFIHFFSIYFMSKLYITPISRVVVSVSTSRSRDGLSRDVPTSRLGLVSVSSRSRPFTSRARAAMVPLH